MWRTNRNAGWLGVATLCVATWLCPPARAADIEGEPIRYSTGPAHNAISRLQERIDAGTARLTYEDHFGYLRGLLRELGVPESSQMLVFSKTSLQRNRIAPKRPRAVYFNDEAYVGFCQRGTVLEVSAVDPHLGVVFYSLDQKPAAKPRFVRQNDACMICHGSSQNQGFSGHLVRSAYVDGDGYPVLSMGTHRTDHSSPLAERWGGWYVTGQSGKQTHMGNLIVRGQHPHEPIDNRDGVNVTDLSGRIKTSAYLTPHSDIVALIVLEHQTEMHNRITRAGFLTRCALREEEEINKALGRPAGQRSESIRHRIESAGEAVVKYLLFCEEAELTEKVTGTSGFAEAFARRGPRDSRGRSLRDLDLKRRLFTYPCSYLIYSAAFDGLPGPVKEHVLSRLWDVLTGKDKTKEFAHLSAADRRAIQEILLATKKGLPGHLRLPARASGS